MLEIKLTDTQQSQELDQMLRTKVRKITHQGWVPHRLLDEESMQEQVAKMYIHTSLPIFLS